MPKQFWRTLVILIIVGAIWYLEVHKPAQLDFTARDVEILKQTTGTSSTMTGGISAIDRSKILKSKSAQYPRAKELVGIEGYINSQPFTLADLVGKKVILLDIWTYSCINCLRTTPYLNAWYEKYKDEGFVIVGVHSPEFDFEKNYDNVLRATNANSITYPVVLDNNHGTWNAYNNRFWPRKYLIDIDGFVVYDHIGEGGYDETERKIQDLLRERATVLGEEISLGDAAITVAHKDDIEVGSPETYFGADRNENLGNGKSGTLGEQFFDEPVTVLLNRLYLIGTWNITEEYAETSATVGSPQVGSDRVNFLYRAKRVYLVAGSKQSVEVEVLRDGKPLEPSVAGRDVFYKDGKSYLHIKNTTLYEVVGGGTYGEHLLEFIIGASGLQLFTFTFG